MRTYTLLVVIIFTCFIPLHTQPVDITIADMPDEVNMVLCEYISILRTASTLDDCAIKLLPIAGGGLVNPSGTALRGSVKPYSLKRDFENIKLYREPFTIERVSKTYAEQLGYGQSAIGGDWYKVYIAKTDGSQSAPIHIVLPHNHPFIKSPKIIQVGSL